MNPRHRLSAKYSVGIKIAFSILLFIGLGFTGVTSLILGVFPDWGPVWSWFLTAVFAYGCYRLVDVILREKRVIEFDDDWLYIINKKDGSEEQIPLRCITTLNRRPDSFRIGAYSFSRYSIHYKDDFYETGKITCMLRNGSRASYEFERRVMIKNPEFKSKHWTHSFDFIDKP